MSLEAPAAPGMSRGQHLNVVGGHGTMEANHEMLSRSPIGQEYGYRFAWVAHTHGPHAGQVGWCVSAVHYQRPHPRGGYAERSLGGGFAGSTDEARERATAAMHAHRQEHPTHAVAQATSRRTEVATGPSPNAEALLLRAAASRTTEPPGVGL